MINPRKSDLLQVRISPADKSRLRALAKKYKFPSLSAFALAAMRAYRGAA